MAQKAYAVRLSGMGDSHWYLLNEADWQHLIACEEWNRYSGLPAPVPPADLIDRAMEDGDDRESVADALTPDAGSSSAGNDVAMAMPASVFNGETFSSYSPSFNDLQAFLKKHDLEIQEEEYEGYLY